MKKKILAVIVSVLTMMTSMTVFAAPQAMVDGNFFDAQYYAQNNPDVVAVFGTDTNTLYMHYLIAGQKEGRKPYGDNADMEKMIVLASQKTIQNSKDLPLGAYSLPGYNELPEFNEPLFYPIKEGDSYVWYSNGQIDGCMAVYEKLNPLQSEALDAINASYIDNLQPGQVISCRWDEKTQKLGEYKVKYLYVNNAWYAGKSNGMIVTKITTTPVVEIKYAE